MRYTPMIVPVLALMLVPIAPALARRPAPVPVQPYAYRVIDNCNGETLDEQGHVVHFGALVIDRDGRVARLIAPGDKAPPTADRIDMHGRVCLPGLIDAHTHVMQTGFQALTLDLSDTHSLDEALAKIRAYAAANPDRPWILGGGWNQEQWGLGRFPTAAELDSAVPDRPVWLRRVDLHAGWANSAAMRAAGVTAATRSPHGGQVILADGRPSGIFVDAAFPLIADHIPPPRPADRDIALEKAQENFLSHGVTAVADMGIHVDDWETYRRAYDAGWLQIRIMAYARTIPDMVTIAGRRPTQWLYDDRLKLEGLKLFEDGALGSRGAWLKAPYADAPGIRGVPLLASAELRNLMSRAAMDHFQVAVHAIGDAANAEVLDAIDELAQTYKGDRRWRIEHAQIVDPADLPRFGRDGIIASMQPQHMASDWRMAGERLGNARLPGSYAWASMLKNGAKLAFGSDTPVEVPDPMTGIAVAITRTDATGQPVGGWMPAERIGREDALAAYTTGAAYAGFAEGRFGSLMPGNHADLAIVDTDPLLASPDQIRHAHVFETWIAGRRVWPLDNAAHDDPTGKAGGS